MRQVREIECVYDPYGVVLYKYHGLIFWIYGLNAMFYSAMVKYFGKDEADRTFYEIYFENKNGGLSPVTTVSEPARAQQSI